MNTTKQNLFVPTHLRVNLLAFAYNVKQNPRFSWWDHSQFSNSQQAAFEIVIANRLHELANQDYLYDSKWVSSANNTAVTLPAFNALLQPGHLYYWQVRVKDNQGRISDFSQPEKFLAAAEIKATNLTGIWAESGPKTDGELPKLGNVIFARSPRFEVDKAELDSAMITAFSRGSEPQFVQGFDLMLNGQTVGVGSARPQADYYGHPDTTGIYYNVFDVSEVIKNGSNVVSVLVGGSDQRRGFWARLTLFYVNGTQKTILVTDETWRALDASSAFGDYGAKIRSIYFGMVTENVDLRYYPQGWTEVAFDDHHWPMAVTTSNQLIADQEVLVPYRSENTTRIETDEPTKELSKLGDQHYLLDLGKEIIGGLKVAIKSNVNQRINVWMGEQLTDDGHVRHHLAAGPDYVETWTLVCGENQFTTFQMKNFRYVEITGFEGVLTADEIKGWAIEQPFDDEEGQFESDNLLLNREYELSKYTIKATNQDVFVDSQARERRPYEGDLLVNGLTSYAVSSQYSLCRHSLDYVIDNPTWPEDYKLFNVEMAWLDYLYTGNDDELRERYVDLKYKLNRGKGADSFDGASQNFKGALKNGRGIDNFDQQVGLVTSNGLVDWPIPERDGFIEGEYNTPFNAVFYGTYRIMSRIAQVTGHPEDASFYANRANIIRHQLIARLYDPETGRFYDSLNKDLSVNRHTAHHSSAYALCYGVYDSQKMADQLADFVANDGHFIGSVYFIYFMLKGLIDSGHADAAVTLLTNPDDQKDAKTFAAILNQLHATIAPEAWSNAYKPNLTFSHPWGATPGLTIIQGIMGINPLKPGFDEFEVRVRPGALTQLRAQTPSAKGLIKVDYERSGQQATLTVGVPMNSQATINLSEQSRLKQIRNGGGKLLDLTTDESNNVFLPSGTYQLTYLAD